MTISFEGDPDFSNARQFWTSGATAFCTMRWCTTNNNVSNTVNWLAGFPRAVPVPPGQDCLRMMLGKGVSIYNSDTCPNINNYVCEVSTVTLIIVEKKIIHRKVFIGVFL